MKVAETENLELAFQCCEHLNRALVVERATMERRHLQEVTVVPWLHAGGAFSTNAYYHMEDPVVVEEVEADGGLDIGLTMIGMHLKRVAVPVHLTNNHVGHALVIGAKTRPPLIGGVRAPVSYTHLDVYKRQGSPCVISFAILSVPDSGSPMERTWYTVYYDTDNRIAFYRVTGSDTLDAAGNVSNITSTRGADVYKRQDLSVRGSRDQRGAFLSGGAKW